MDKKKTSIAVGVVCAVVAFLFFRVAGIIELGIIAVIGAGITYAAWDYAQHRDVIEKPMEKHSTCLSEFLEEAVEKASLSRELIARGLHLLVYDGMFLAPLRIGEHWIFPIKHCPDLYLKLRAERDADYRYEGVISDAKVRRLYEMKTLEGLTRPPKIPFEDVEDFLKLSQTAAKTPGMMEEVAG